VPVRVHVHAPVLAVLLSGRLRDVDQGLSVCLRGRLDPDTYVGSTCAGATNRQRRLRPRLSGAKTALDAGYAKARLEGPSNRGLMRGSIRSGARWTLVGNVGYWVSQYGILMTMARLGSPAEVGVFALGLAVGAPIVILTNLNLRAALVTDARDEHPVG